MFGLLSYVGVGSARVRSSVISGSAVLLCFGGRCGSVDPSVDPSISPLLLVGGVASVFLRALILLILLLLLLLLSHGSPVCPIAPPYRLRVSLLREASPSWSERSVMTALCA